MKKILVFLFLFSSLSSFSQRKLDSLQNLLSGSLADTQRVKVLISVQHIFLTKGKMPEALTKAKEALSLAQKSGFGRGECSALEALGVMAEYQGNFEEAFKYFDQQRLAAASHKDPLNVCYSFSNKGNCYMDQSKYEEALKEYKQAMEAALTTGDKKSIALCHGHLGDIHTLQGNYADALKEYLIALSTNEEIHNKHGIAHHLGTVGNIYYYQGNLQQALNYYEKSLDLLRELGEKEKMPSELTNCGVIHRQMNKPEEAMKDYKQALNIARESGDKKSMGEIYHHLGILDQSLKKYEEALVYFHLAISLQKEMNDIGGEADTYSEVAHTESESGHQAEALLDFEKALELAKISTSKESQKNVYAGMADVYEKLKNYPKAYEFFVRSTQIKDSLVNSDNNKQIAQMNALYQSEKKDKEIQLNEAELKKQKAEAEKQASQQRVFVIGFILVACVALFILAFAIYIFRSYRQKQKAHRIIALQKALVDEKNKDITDSINYAKRIQEAVLPSDSLRQKLFPESFILFLPKDIVSGDFYWFSEKNGKKIIAAVDCTGHGVPGAFMSMIGNAFLNEIVNERGITTPALVLDQLREMIIASLKQQESDNKDGMDITLVSIDLVHNKLEYAGANNPLWIVRNGNLEEIKATKQPIGLYGDQKQPFINHSVELHDGDTFYLFTDGYADQFGGEKGKKFKYKTLQEKLISISSCSPSEQKDILQNTFLDWKGVLEQVDDVCVIGIKV